MAYMPLRTDVPDGPGSVTVPSIRWRRRRMRLPRCTLYPAGTPGERCQPALGLGTGSRNLDNDPPPRAVVDNECRLLQYQPADPGVFHFSRGDVVSFDLVLLPPSAEFPAVPAQFADQSDEPRFVDVHSSGRAEFGQQGARTRLPVQDQIAQIASEEKPHQVAMLGRNGGRISVDIGGGPVPGENVETGAEDECRMRLLAVQDALERRGYTVRGNVGAGTRVALARQGEEVVTLFGAEAQRLCQRGQNVVGHPDVPGLLEEEYQETLMLARSATSSRRRPGVRRCDARDVRPTASG